MEVVFVSPSRSDQGNAAYAQTRLLNSPSGVVVKGPPERARQVANMILRDLEWYILGVETTRKEERGNRTFDVLLVPILPSAGFKIKFKGADQP